MANMKTGKREEEKHTEKGTQLQSKQMQEAQGNVKGEQEKADEK